MLFCTNCGNNIEPGANFCNACGTRVELLQPEPVAKEEPAKKTGNYTKEGRKIIDGGPKAAKQSSAKTGSSVKSTPRKVSPKKKEKTLLGCFFQTVLVLFSIVVVSAFLIYVVNILLVEDDSLTNTNIPGIVDIEPADEVAPSVPETKLPVGSSTTTFQESKALKNLANKMEEAFSMADTLQLKQMLTPTSAGKYQGFFKEMEPHMREYAEAFKKRKLVKQGDHYALYAITDQKGNVFTVEFSMVEKDVWKLVRF